MHKEIFMVSETVDTTALNSHQVYSNNWMYSTNSTGMSGPNSSISNSTSDTMS